MYSLSDYLWIVADERRAAAYASALRAAIKPGDRVLEVGTGVGFLAVVAARAGAGHVDAIDTNPAIHLSARVAALNGCEDRITFHHSAVADVAVPMPADVLIIDVRGPTPCGPTMASAASPICTALACNATCPRVRTGRIVATADAHLGQAPAQCGGL